MSDGHRCGRSTGRVSCKSTELKRCSMIEMRWNKYEVSLALSSSILLLLLSLFGQSQMNDVSDKGAFWRHLVNAMERSVRAGDTAIRHIILTNCVND